MRFWDASAIVPLLVQQPAREVVNAIRSADADIAVWWGTIVECASAIAKLKRLGLLDESGTATALASLERVAESWIEVEPGEDIRTCARELVAKHELTTGDAFQLAAALRGGVTEGRLPEFVCLGRRLRRAAMNEGFPVLPESSEPNVAREPAAQAYGIRAKNGRQRAPKRG